MATSTLYIGTYINFFNGNASEFLNTIITTFVCKSRYELESTMFIYIMKDLDEFCECYYDENGYQFESDEELYTSFRAKFPTFNEQMDTLKNFYYEQRNEDYTDIEVKIEEVQITDASCPYTVTIMKDG